MTDYIVFRFEKPGEALPGYWQIMVQVEARSAESAIKKYVTDYLEATGGEEAQYAAVPYRSWKPVTVKVETKTALKFS